MSIARESIDAVLVHRSEGPEGSRADLKGFLGAKRGAFVTLNTVEGGLRGCIGIPYPVMPLRHAVSEAAVGAATRDPRFPRVTASELESIVVEVSALTEPEVIECKPEELPNHVHVGADGLIVSGLGTSGLLLPQVATDLGLDQKSFLSLTCEKAGLFADAWLNAGIRVQRFQAEIFSELSPRGEVGDHSAFS